MIVAATIFVNRQPGGVVRQDSNSGEIDFSPHEGLSPLSQRCWKGVDALKLAVIAAYLKTKKIPEIRPGFSVLLTENTDQATNGDLIDA